jgi:hypothetical protein
MGGRVVETGWKGPLGRVRNWVSPAGAIWLEVRFSVMVRSLGLHRIAAFPSGKHLAARSYWGLVARVNLILKVASLWLGWSYEVAHEGYRNLYTTVPKNPLHILQRLTFS